MRKLIMKMSMSLDGFVSGANGKNDWIFKTGDEDSLAWSVGAISQAALIIMGRKSFEGIGHLLADCDRTFCPSDERDPQGCLYQKRI
jgi:dihydrofolate reductase